ncbi:hypothetical protein FQN60_000680, partial [Etheostoma spectabile]
MASSPPHDRSRKDDDDDDDPVERMISRTGCAELHYAVQECMAEHQDWRVCQSQVQTFKDCMMNFQIARKEQLMKQATSTDILVTVFKMKSLDSRIDPDQRVLSLSLASCIPPCINPI